MPKKKTPKKKIIAFEKAFDALFDALQVIDEYVRSRSSSSSGGGRSYHSYELNVIMKDSSRINLFDHGGRNRVHKDAKALAESLNVPLLTRD